MERIVQATSDGSYTIAIPEMQVTYHSKHGAIQESMHVFINAGLKYLMAQVTGPISILEMGFGTGLNALLSMLEQTERQICYESLEAYPLDKQLADNLNYGACLNDPSAAAKLRQLHEAPWDQRISLTPYFQLHKHCIKLDEFQPAELYDLVYFDAFAPSAQPSLWTTEVFKKLIDCLNPGGILVTYCSKGDVRRAMQAAGFSVEKIPGPPGKREMVRATKPIH